MRGRAARISPYDFGSFEANRTRETGDKRQPVGG
jgi:hypothetical protein